MLLSSYSGLIHICKECTVYCRLAHHGGSFGGSQVTHHHFRQVVCHLIEVLNGTHRERSHALLVIERLYITDDFYIHPLSAC